MAGWHHKLVIEILQLVKRFGAVIAARHFYLTRVNAGILTIKRNVSEVLGGQASFLSNTSKHARSDLHSLMKSEDEIGPSGPLQNAV